MGRTVYRRMDILKQIADAVTGIGEKVFITDRPAAEQKAMKDFVVIRLPQTIQDKGSTYQDTYCQINVFAHDRSNGIENTVRLDEMQMEVVSKFPIVTELFSAVSPRLLPGGNDGLGFHSLIIQAKYNPQIQISAESETKRSIFREKDKTKRSKKESAQHSKSRNKSFVMTSVSAL